MLLSPILDLFFALTLRRRNAVAFYDGLAPRYERIHQRWLRARGAESIAALRGCLVAELRPGARVLDAGCVHAEGQQYLVSLRVANLEARLPNPPFLRVHRSHIVNLDHVERMVSFDDARLQVRMKTGAKVPVSRVRSQEIRRRAR